MSDLHFFDRRGVEVAEGSEASVVQYTEADAKQRGLALGLKQPPAPAPPVQAKPAKPQRRRRA